MTSSSTPDASPIRILGLDHVVFRIRDLDAALRFWCGALGAVVERELLDLGLVQLRTGAHLIDLVPFDSKLGRAGGGPPDPDARNCDHVALRVEALDEPSLRAHLAAHGVEGGAIERRYGAEGQGPSIYLRDPDGNVIELKGPPDTEVR